LDGKNTFPRTKRATPGRPNATHFATTRLHIAGADDSGSGSVYSVQTVPTVQLGQQGGTAGCHTTDAWLGMIAKGSLTDLRSDWGKTASLWLTRAIIVLFFFTFKGGLCPKSAELLPIHFELDASNFF
jgi:hypothetical protein